MRRAATTEGELTEAEEEFCGFIAAGYRQAEAYRKAFPASLKWKPNSVWSAASTLAAGPKVKARITALATIAQANTQLTVERVLLEMQKLAFYDPRELFDKDGNPLRMSELGEDIACAIAGVDVVTIGNADAGIGEVRKYKLADKKGALEMLGRHLAMFKDQLKIAADSELLQALRESVGNTSRLPIKGKE